jgi:hypothetical protein
MKKTNLNRCQPSLLSLIVLSIASGSVGVGCKSRLFSFSEDMPVANENTPPKDLTTGGVAIGDGGAQAGDTPISSDTATASGSFKAVQGEKKEIPIGSTATYSLTGQKVDITFEKILEDSRCPKDVVCIWEGQAKLQFSLTIPSVNLNKTVIATLRAGHPELGQVSVGSVALALVKLTPEAVSTGQKADSPVATVVVGKAP